jgi:hypothetical protein
MYDQQHPSGSFQLPQPPVPAITPANFVACPFALMQWFSPLERLCQSFLYQMAFEQAQADARPSLLERDLLAMWN